MSKLLLKDVHKSNLEVNSSINSCTIVIYNLNKSTTVTFSDDKLKRLFKTIEHSFIFFNNGKIVNINTSFTLTYLDVTITYSDSINMFEFKISDSLEFYLSTEDFIQLKLIVKSSIT